MALLGVLEHVSSTLMHGDGRVKRQDLFRNIRTRETALILASHVSPVAEHGSRDWPSHAVFRAQNLVPSVSCRSHTAIDVHCLVSALGNLCHEAHRAFVAVKVFDRLPI